MSNPSSNRGNAPRGQNSGYPNNNRNSNNGTATLRLNQGDRLDVFTVVERGEGKKVWWVSVGSAWVNRDGSLNIRLDALPVNGQLQVRMPRADDAPQGNDNGGNHGPY